MLTNYFGTCALHVQGPVHGYITPGAQGYDSNNWDYSLFYNLNIFKLNHKLILFFIKII